jgi:hypothetical protein
MAAPRIPLKTLTRDRADFSCCRAAEAWRASDEPEAETAFAVAVRAATCAAAPVIVAARRIRDPLISSSAMLRFRFIDHLIDNPLAL